MLAMQAYVMDSLQYSRNMENITGSSRVLVMCLKTLMECFKVSTVVPAF